MIGRSRRTAVMVALAALALPACTRTDSLSNPTTPPVTASPTDATTVPPTSAETTTTSTTSTTTTTVVLVTIPESKVVKVRKTKDPIAAVGTSNGDDTRAAQERLLQLGFWLEDANGTYDLTTVQAVMAFQKYYGLAIDGSIGPGTAEKLSGRLERPRGRATAGTLAEIDKSRQLLFIVHDGEPVWVFNISTGKEIAYKSTNKNTGLVEEGDAVTPQGLFEIFTQRKEGWWAGDLGQIYRPKYFDGGIAIHGYGSVPAVAASHGCVRVSVPAMDWIWDEELLPQHTAVWVYGNIPTPA